MVGRERINNMLCPICDRVHTIELKERKAEIVIKKISVQYMEEYLYCSNENCEFESGAILKKNLLNARNEYRKNQGLLTSHEIVEIRDMYGLSQVELSKILGIGEATISRYESKAIQDEAYDTILRNIRKDPNAFLEYFRKNQAGVSIQRQQEIMNNINDLNEKIGRELVSRKALEAQYVQYEDLSEYNGNVRLNIDKIECIVTILAENIKSLYKVKLMKLLWYIDSLASKELGVGITGLVYKHQAMGALPHRYEFILNLNDINTRESYSNNYHTKVEILPNEKIVSILEDKDEMELVHRVIEKFRDYSTKEIVNYMHDEVAYLETMAGDVIPYNLAAKIRDF